MKAAANNRRTLWLLKSCINWCVFQARLHPCQSEEHQLTRVTAHCLCTHTHTTSKLFLFNKHSHIYADEVILSLRPRVNPESSLTKKQLLCREQSHTHSQAVLAAMENLHDHCDWLPSTRVTSNRVSLSQLCVCVCACACFSACVCSSCLSVHCRVLTREGKHQSVLCLQFLHEFSGMCACMCMSEPVPAPGPWQSRVRSRLQKLTDWFWIQRSLGFVIRLRAAGDTLGKPCWMWLKNGNVAEKGHPQSQRQAVREQGDGSRLQKWLPLTYMSLNVKAGVVLLHSLGICVKLY